MAIVITSYSIHYTKLYEDQRGIARHEFVFQVGDLSIQRDRFDRAMRLQHDRAAGRVVTTAGFHADVAVLDDVGATDSVRGAKAIEGLRITSYNVCYTKLLRFWALSWS